jgi:hypothetical protein
LSPATKRQGVVDGEISRLHQQLSNLPPRRRFFRRVPHQPACWPLKSSGPPMPSRRIHPDRFRNWCGLRTSLPSAQSNRAASKGERGETLGVLPERTPSFLVVRTLSNPAAIRSDCREGDSGRSSAERGRFPARRSAYAHVRRAPCHDPEVELTFKTQDHVQPARNASDSSGLPSHPRMRGTTTSL